MTLRRILRRWHVWLGWLVGVPLLLWTLSGLAMVVRPIEEVRGAELLAPQACRLPRSRSSSARQVRAG
jgi:uncharacterized iron-regulated membrane protein